MSARFCFIRAYAREYVHHLQLIAEDHCPVGCNHMENGVYVQRAEATGIFKTSESKQLFNDLVLESMDHYWVSLNFQDECQKIRIPEWHRNAFLEACDPFWKIHGDWSDKLHEVISQYLY
jgi:hypothetical protein